MSVSSVNNKRIAKNTLFLYFRQILVMAVSLYTVRVVLEVLGEEDYGIYNVVGGFVALFNILSGALSVAIGRFITYGAAGCHYLAVAAHFLILLVDTDSHGACHLLADRHVRGLVRGA